MERRNMKAITGLLLSIFLGLTTTAFAGENPLTLTVNVKGIEKQEGSIRVALYDQTKTFLTKNWLVGKVAEANAPEVTLIFEGLKRGNYAVSIFQDYDNNEELDKNFVGAPTEPYAFGNDAFGIFGPPSFEESTITLSETQEITINLR
ncbi:MAG: DUF2141 domain-containing protein [SAR324 cluster bacterium]|nr:DUF2141 domain-containing protein [SAR324 cluster bacterium]